MIVCWTHAGSKQLHKDSKVDSSPAHAPHPILFFLFVVLLLLFFISLLFLLFFLVVKQLRRSARQVKPLKKKYHPVFRPINFPLIKENDCLHCPPPGCQGSVLHRQRTDIRKVTSATLCSIRGAVVDPRTRKAPLLEGLEIKKCVDRIINNLMSAELSKKNCSLCRSAICSVMVDIKKISVVPLLVSN